MAASLSFWLDVLSVFLCFGKLIGKGEVDLAVLKLPHRDTSWFGLTDVGIYTRDGSTLKLFAALRGKDDHSIFRVDHRRIDDLFLGRLVNLFVDLFLVGHKFLPSLLRIDASMHRNYQEYPEWHWFVYR